MRVTGLQLRHAVIACSAAVALASAAAWSSAQQPAPAAKPAAAHPAAPKPAKPAERPLWRDLTPAQRTALEPLSGEWDQMDAVRKQKWLEMSTHFANMKPEEQARIHERMREWVRLTPAERKLARETYKRTKKLAPNEKTATWESYKQLPEEQKQKLAAQAAARKGATPPAGATHAVSPLRKGATTCPAGTVKNKLSATPPCVPAPPAAAAVTAPAPAAVQPSTATPAAPAEPPANAQ